MKVLAIGGTGLMGHTKALQPLKPKRKLK